MEIFLSDGIIVDADSNEAVGYVQCKKCKVAMKYDSKWTGIPPCSAMWIESASRLMMPVGFCNRASPPSLVAQEKSHSRTNRKCPSLIKAGYS